MAEVQQVGNLAGLAAPGAPVEERIAFQCKADAVKPVVVLLSGISNGKKDQHAFVTANETGLLRMVVA
jgi:hypothetical protein